MSDYFNSGNQNTDGTQTTNQEDWVQKVVKTKGEQWGDPQALAKGYLNAQEYIAELERQTGEMREDLVKQDYAKKLMEQLSTNQGQPNGGEVTGAPKENTTPKPSEIDIKSLIKETLTEQENERTATQNLRVANDKLTEMFGTEVANVMEKRSQELGMSKERLQALASESPTAFLTLIGEQKQENTQPLVNGSLNTSATVQVNTGERTFGYYQELRRKDPTTYYSPKVQNEMLQDRLRLGDKFMER